VQIARKENGFAGRIRWTDANGHWVGDRRLTSRRSDCTEIAASLAFSVAVQVQLLTALAPPVLEPAAPPPVPEPAAAPAAPPPAARVPDASVTAVVPPIPAPPPEPPGQRLKLSVGLGPALALGMAPRATGVARIFVSGRLARLSLEIAADAALPVTQHEVDGSGFSLGRFAGGAAVCGHAQAFAACVIATLGRLQARGIGVDMPAAPSGLFSQVGARIAATRDFGRYFAAARLDGLVTLSTWTVTLNQTAAWTTPRVGALVGLDFGARFF
jgi:hypothetical protein